MQVHFADFGGLSLGNLNVGLFVFFFLHLDFFPRLKMYSMAVPPGSCVEKAADFLL